MLKKAGATPPFFMVISFIFVFNSIMNLSQRFASPLLRNAGLCLSLTLACAASPAQTTPEPDTSKSAPTAAVPAPAILARGHNGLLVSAQDVLSELQRAPEATRKAMMSRPESLQQLANNILVRRTLAAEGEQEHLGKDPMVAASLTLAHDRILSDARLLQLDTLNTPNKATLDKNVAEVYKANTTRFDQPAQTRARHILLDKAGPDSLQKAQELLAQLRAGASFEDMAKTHSTDDGSAVKGGDLGFFPAGKMVQVFDDALKALVKPGDLSEPVLSQFGYHIIRLEERREQHRQPLDEVREQLSNEVIAAIRTEARMKRIQKLSSDFSFDKDAIDALAKTSAR